MVQSNLDSFLHRTSPQIPSTFISSAEIGNRWCPSGKEKVQCFTLSDLWRCYDEWSAYGAGVPVTLNDDELVVQYYVPYLSAIQIFTTPSAFRDETESDKTDYLSSDTSGDESESDKLSRWDGVSSEEGDGVGVVTELGERLGCLYFQYFESLSPYKRVPLMDKICEFARQYPDLMTLRNVDLSPASWLAVAWYPIYHIPMGRAIKDISTCFITYHTLSSSFQDLDQYDANMEVCERKKQTGDDVISLEAFGLATYRMQGDVWLSSNNDDDQEKLLSLASVADSWLKQLKVQHHDFNFFMGSAINR